MADDKSNRGPADRARINIHNPTNWSIGARNLVLSRNAFVSWSASMGLWLRIFAVPSVNDEN
jgi:hypothetical protein